MLGGFLLWGMIAVVEIVMHLIHTFLCVLWMGCLGHKKNTMFQHDVLYMSVLYSGSFDTSVNKPVCWVVQKV